MNYQRAYNFQADILNNKISTENLAEVFKKQEKDGITSEELLGFFKASFDIMKILPGENKHLLDTCGTGGDGQKTLNISTITAVVCAACGAKVAKHGNRSATSLCGSADALEALGVNINMSPQQSASCLKKCGITFMLAPVFHPAFVYAKDARKLYGKKTYFNILGPLLNPAKAEFRLIGVGDDKMLELILGLVPKLDLNRALIVRSADGLDEISPCAVSQVYEILKGGKTKEFIIDPKNFGFPQCQINDLRINGIDEAKKAFLEILEGKADNAKTAAVVLNSAAGLLCANIVKSLEEGIKIAYNALHSGKALAKFEQFKEASNAP